MSSHALRPLLNRRLAAVVLACVVLTGCGASNDFSESDTAEWLRIAGDFNESPEEISCVEAAMHDLLSEDELELWLSQDPEDITVEEVQGLPHAIDIADRCR